MADGFDDDLFNVFDGAETKQQQSTPKGKDVPKSDIARYRTHWFENIDLFG